VKRMEIGSNELILMKMFESITGVMPLDILQFEDALFFSVDKERIREAIGPKGIKIEKLMKRLNKRVYVFADAEDIEEFIRNFFNNVNIISIDVEDIMGERVVYLLVDERDKKKALGKRGTRINALRELLKRKFNAKLAFKTKVMV